MIKEILDAALSGRNSVGIAARAARLVEFDDTVQLRALLGSLPRSERTAVLGGGNNILFTHDFDGTLLRSADRTLRFAAPDACGVTVRAGAGVDWNDFVAEAVARGLWGAENLAGIPGTVGAAPVQNIGAYGAEAKDIIESVECLDLTTMKETVIAGRYCGFGYRDSIFKGVLRGRTVITAVNFRLSAEPRPKLDYGALREETLRRGEPSPAVISDAVRAIRGSKLPDPAVTGNAGSFFKNPVVASAEAERLRTEYPDMPSFATDDPGKIKIPAGWLIERAGWRGRDLGRAGVYERQALILVNRGGATGEEVMALARAVIADVRDRFGITIETEVNIW